MTDEPSQWTTWVQAISFLSRVLDEPVLPAGRPDDPRNLTSLRWAGDYVLDEDDPEYGYPEWIVVLTMLDDPNKVTMFVDMLDEDMEPISQRIIGWAVTHRVTLQPSGDVGGRGINPIPLLSDAEAEARYGKQPEIKVREKVVDISHRHKPPPDAKD